MNGDAALVATTLEARAFGTTRFTAHARAQPMSLALCSMVPLDSPLSDSSDLTCALVCEA
jgi:hypothetical protein